MINVNNYDRQCYIWGRPEYQQTDWELGSCVKVAEAVLGSPSLKEVRTVSVDVKQHWTGTQQILTLLTLLTAAKTFSGKAVAETYVRIKRDQTFTEKRQGCDRDLVAYTETKHLVPSDKAVTERPGRMQTWPNP